MCETTFIAVMQNIVSHRDVSQRSRVRNSYFVIEREP